MHNMSQAEFFWGVLFIVTIFLAQALERFLSAKQNALMYTVLSVFGLTVCYFYKVV